MEKGRGGDGKVNPGTAAQAEDGKWDLSWHLLTCATGNLKSIWFEGLINVHYATACLFFWSIGQINVCFGSCRKVLVNAHQRSAMLSVAILFSQARKGDVISQLCFLFILKFMLLLATLVSSYSYPVLKAALNLFFFF